jgi:hypothetical protein
MRWVETLAVKQLLGEFTKLKKRLLAWSGLSLCLSTQNNSAPTRQILMKLDEDFSKLCSENLSLIKIRQE